MKFVFDDGGRATAGFKGATGDCVVRAVAIATKQPYQKVYDALSEGCRTQRMGKRKTRKQSARAGVNVRRKWFKDYMRSIGWQWTPTMQIGSGCKVHLTDGELPIDRLIVALSGHYTAVIDRVIHDIYNPCRRTYEYNAFGELIGKDTRCVYGYWSPSGNACP